WFNNHDGTFREDGQAAGVAMADQSPDYDPEGAQAVDWNGDGYLDLYAGHHLFQNDGTGHFTDVHAQVGLPDLFDEGMEWVDYDNDGDWDLYLHSWEGPHLFRNDGGTFHEVTSEVGLPETNLSWGDRWVDIDNDGDLDLFLSDLTKHMRLYLN